MMGIVPKSVGKYFNLINQNYSGNVTIWPTPSFQNFFEYWRIQEKKDLEKDLSLDLGALIQVITFLLNKRFIYLFIEINHIQATMSIEKALEINYAKIRHTKRDLMEELEEYDPNFEASSIFSVDSKEEVNAFFHAFTLR